jgi:hypothetical protein
MFMLDSVLVVVRMKSLCTHFLSLEPPWDAQVAIQRVAGTTALRCELLPQLTTAQDIWKPASTAIVVKGVVSVYHELATAANKDCTRDL